MSSRKCLVTLGIIVCFSLLVNLIAGCAKPAPTVAPVPVKPRVDLDFWAGPMGGTMYLGLFPIVDLLNKLHPWLRATIVETKGGADNLLNSGKDLAKRPTTFFGAPAPTYHEALKGLGAFKGVAPPEGIRFIAALVTTTFGPVAFDPKIKAGSDLEGKRVGIYPKGSGGYWDAMKYLEYFYKTKDGRPLATYEHKDDRVKLSFMDHASLLGGLRDGLLDVIWVPQPWSPDHPDARGPMVEELMAVRPLYPVPLTKAEYESGTAEMKAKGMYANSWVNIPKDHYVKGWPEHGCMMLVPCSLSTYKEASDEVVYEVTKLLFEQTERFKAYGAYTIGMVPIQMVENLSFLTSEKEFHPAALKYLKEKGLYPKYLKLPAS